MNMDHLIGQRFSLISKSEIRYVGTLHQINPEEATIALEDVLSFGTEQRSVEKFVPPSQQKFEFIVFRGSDVKDIKVVEDEEPKQSTPPNIPNDPAILNSSRPGQQGPPPPQGPPQDRRESPYPPPPGYPQQYSYPPHYPPQFGRGYGPAPPAGFPPGPGFNPYGPPPPGYFGPPHQGFPGQGQFQGPPPPQSGAPPTQRGGPPQHGQPQAPPQPSQPTPELPVDNRSAQQPPAIRSPAPRQTLETKPPSQAPPSAPTGPKAGTHPKGKVTPAVPFTVNQKSFTPPVLDAPAAQSTPKQVQTKAEMDEATLRAKQAVQEALAKLPGNNATKTAPVPTAAAIDALAQKVGELGTTTNGTSRGRGGPRGGRGAHPRGGSSIQSGRKIEIPKSDYDFESANKKFNKEDLIKEAIASGSPAADEGPADAPEDAPAEGVERKDNLSTSNKAYNKSTSFFDNISSEARDREDHTDGRAHARQNRADEFKKNVDTFGQGNVDGGYRGRGRGGYRGRSYGGNRGYRGGYNRGYGPRGGRGSQGQAQADPQAPPTTTAQIQL